MTVHLNNIHAEPGTLIGIDFRTKRMLVVEESRVEVDHHGDWHDVVYLREATPEEMTPESRFREPRSVAEHRILRRRMSPYGLIRQFKPRPTKVVKIEFPTAPNLNRKMRRALERDGLIHKRSNVYPRTVRRDDGY